MALRVAAGGLRGESGTPMDILGEINAEGTTVVPVSHEAKVTTRSDRVLYMVDGRILFDRVRAGAPARTSTRGTPS